MLHGMTYPIFQKRFSDSETGSISTTYGTLLTGGASDVYGSYAEVLSDATLTEDCYALSILLHASGVSTTARFNLATIGKDETGGTSYSDWISDLACGQRANLSLGACYYYFPLYIKAGTSIAAKVRSSTASGGTRCSIIAHGRPKYPETIWCGSKVKNFTFGAITLGQGSEGAWTAAGQAIDDNYWWWQMGANFNDTTQSTQTQVFDLSAGDASNKKHIFGEFNYGTQTTEQGISSSMLLPLPIRRVTANDTLYIRGQCSGTPDSSCSPRAYGVV